MGHLLNAGMVPATGMNGDECGRAGTLRKKPQTAQRPQVLCLLWDFLILA